jgi:hypothetical protein
VKVRPSCPDSPPAYVAERDADKTWTTTVVRSRLPGSGHRLRRLVLVDDHAASAIPDVE